MANAGLGTVFEGPAHPYKENLLKVDGRTRGVVRPELKISELEQESEKSL